MYSIRLSRPFKYYVGIYLRNQKVTKNWVQKVKVIFL